MDGAGAQPVRRQRSGAKAMRNCTATGCLVEYVPAGDDREMLLGLLRIAAPFAAQQRVGKRPEFLRNYIAGIVAEMKDPPTFENLRDELMLAATRRAAGDGKHEPIERVSESFELVIYHHPTRGRQQVTFGHVRNLLTAAKNR